MTVRSKGGILQRRRSQSETCTLSCEAVWQPAAGWQPARSAGKQPARRLTICPTICARRARKLEVNSIGRCVILLLSALCLVAECGAQNLPFTVEQAPGPAILRPYRAQTVPAARLNNSSRLRELLRAGKLYLTVRDAIALAIENDLGLEIDRYGPLLAQSALQRAKAGGPLRGVPSASAQVSSVNSGVGVNGSTRAWAAEAAAAAAADLAATLPSSRWARSRRISTRCYRVPPRRRT